MMLMAILPILAFTLIALGIGCMVCQNAKKDTGALKIIGYIIGIIIVVVTIVSLGVLVSSLISRRGPQTMMPRQMMPTRQPRMQSQGLPKGTAVESAPAQPELQEPTTKK